MMTHIIELKFVHLHFFSSESATTLRSASLLFDSQNSIHLARPSNGRGITKSREESLEAGNGLDHARLKIKNLRR